MPRVQQHVSKTTSSVIYAHYLVAFKARRRRAPSSLDWCLICDQLLSSHYLVSCRSSSDVFAKPVEPYGPCLSVFQSFERLDPHSLCSCATITCLQLSRLECGPLSTGPHGHRRQWTAINLFPISFLGCNSKNLKLREAACLPAATLKTPSPPLFDYLLTRLLRLVNSSNPCQ